MIYLYFLSSFLQNNAILARRLLNGELEPSKILNMTPNELKVFFFFFYFPSLKLFCCVLLWWIYFVDFILLFSDLNERLLVILLVFSILYLFNTYPWWKPILMFLSNVNQPTFDLLICFLCIYTWGTLLGMSTNKYLFTDFVLWFAPEVVKVLFGSVACYWKQQFWC